MVEEIKDSQYSKWLYTKLLMHLIGKLKTGEMI
jgi:hypothetical protein